MKQYEFKFLDVGEYGDRGYEQKQLNDYGSQGWRVVGVVRNISDSDLFDYIVIMEREVVPDAAPPADQTAEGIG